MRKLTLKKENLAELTADELSGVLGGAISGLSCPVCSDFAACVPTGRCTQSIVNC